MVCGILTLGQHLHKVALRMTEPGQTLLTLLYFALPHLEWYFNYRDLLLFNQPLVSWLAIGGATLYAALFAAFFLVAAWLAFRRKTLTL